MGEFRYLLDTNILSDLVKNPAGPVKTHIAQRGEAALCTSIVVACELRYGAARKKSPRLSAQLESVLSALPILPFDAPCDVRYADLRAHLEALGRPIGGNDMLIAAHALALDVTLVTANVGEFARVPRLRLENWLEI
ncbi:MAG: type II toxin-antitoxin system VapC family toxin [Methylococcaceae bacterium]|nr:MAG: type II toxin-antitoxin system VapC family toxin [Methylococcaceae bacterium]